MRSIAQVVAKTMLIIGALCLPIFAHAAIQYIGSNTGTSNTTYPAGTQIGDLVIAFAFRGNSVSSGTLPSGWTSIHDSGSNTNWARVAFRYAEGGAGTNSGTFGSSDGMFVLVYRGARTDYSATNTPVFSGPNAATAASITYPSINLGTSSAYLLRLAGFSDDDVDVGTAPGGSVNRAVFVETGGFDTSSAGHDSNGVTFDTATKTVAIGQADPWRAYTLALQAAPAIPTITLTAASTTIGLGQTTTLTWSTVDATSCTASGGWSGSVGTSGSTTTSPLTAATVYTLTCSSTAGSTSTSVTVAPGITIDNVNTTTQGFRVFAYTPTGVTTTVAIHATAPAGYGVTGTVSGATEEIGNAGAGSEMLRVLFDSAVATATMQLAWIAGTDAARYVLYDASGTIVGSSTITGGSDAIDPPVTLSASAPFVRVEFTAPTTGSDYLINNIVFYPAPVVIPPAVSGYVNNSEGTLTNGGRTGQSITVTGTNFGSTCVDGTNFVSIGTYTVPCASVSSWSDTTITFTIPSGISSIGGTGTNGLKVTVGANTTSGATFFVYPSIIAVAAVGTNAAREYSVADTSGLIQLIGTGFGTTAGTVVFSGVWGSATGTVHAIAEGSCTVGGWASTTVCVEVPSSIPDNAYTATITLTSANGATTSAPTLTILPRITSVSPSPAVVGDTITITGNHFCEAITCPASLSVLDAVTFGITSATTLISWTDTQIQVLLPSGVATGTQLVNVTSNSLTSNTGSITVVVPPTASLTAASTTIAAGGSTTLTWSSTDATTCTASGGWSGSVGTSGSTSTGALATTSTFTLACTGAGGTATSSVTVTTVPVPTITFTSATSTVLFNASTTLTWSTTNATTCTASGGWSGVLAPSGASSTGPIASSTTFTLSCSGIGGATSSSVTVAVIPLPSFAFFTATPPSVNENGTTTLSWSVANATACTASGGWSGAQPTSGSSVPSPLVATTTFTLTCTGPSGTATSSVTVGVTLAPVVGSYTNTTEPTLTNGGRPGQSITITGTNFGSACSTGTNFISIGGIAVPCSSVTSWSDTSITFTIPSTLGTFGGSGLNGLTVTAGGQPSTGSTFYVYPDVVSSSPATSTGAVVGGIVTFSGTNFGNATGTVVFVCPSGNATSTVTSWVTSSVSVSVPAGISSNDTSCAVQISNTAGDSTVLFDTLTGFRILPSVTAIAAVATNAAREYVGTDTHGLIQIIGTNFGSTTGTVVFSGGWGTATGTIHALAEGSCTVGGWASTTVCVEVPSSIPDNAYTATITMIRTDGVTTTAPTLTILPRITNVAPTTALAGDTVTITGDHLCQGGVCPVSLSGLNSISFGTTSATTLISWTDTQIQVQVPSGVAVGTSSIIVTTNGSTSNTGSILIVVPPTVSLAAASSTVAVGGSTTLTWSSTDATTCTASGGWSGVLAPSGASSTGPIASSTTFTLACTGAGGTATSSVTVNTVGTPVITFSAATSTVALNGNTTLTWSSTDATTCTASGGWSGSVGTSGATSTGALSTTTTFTLACTGTGGTATSSVTVNVIPLPTFTSFTATPSTVNENGTTTLTWSSTDATTCTASGGWSGVFGPSGSTSSVPLTATTTFTLACTGPSGTATSSIVVTVSASPTISGYTNTTEPTLTNGGRPGQSITITGTNFGSACSTGTNFISIGGIAVPCSSVTSWSDTSITFTVPSTLSTLGGAGTSGITVTAGGQASAGTTFYMYPDITGTSPIAAAGASVGSVVTLAGTGFGTTTGTVVFVCPSGNATSTIGSWSTSTVSVTVPAGISSNDTSCSVQLTTLASVPLTDTITGFVIRPSITAIAAIGTNAAREYSASDTAGLIQLIGTNFGSTTGTVVFSGGWGTATGTIHTLVEGSCSAGGWTSTTVCVEVPAGIPDNAYTVAVTLVRADGSTAAAPTLTVLPRVTNISPLSALVGETITITGNHLCQGGVCPVSLSGLNSISFGTTSATTLISWTDTQIQVQVPNGVLTGVQSVVVTTNGESVNAGSITVISSVPDVPSLGPSVSEGQFNATLSSIGIGGSATTTTIVFKASMSAGTSSNLALEVEVKLIDTPFDGTGVVAGAAVAYPGTGTVIGMASTTLAGDESYHWRARVRNTNTNELSAWVAFGANPSGDGSGDGDPANTDFTIVTSGPTIGGVGTAPSCTAHDQVHDVSARISWTASSPLGNASIVNTVRVSTSSDMSAYTAYPASNGGSPQVTLTGLTAETVYYYQLVSEDTLAEQTFSPTAEPFCTFVTEASQKRINKLSEFYICQANTQNPVWNGGAGVSCISGDDGAKTFNVFVSEMTGSNPVVQTSPFVEVFGIAEATSDFTVTVRVNDGPTRTHTIKNPSGSVPFRVLYYVDNGFNLDYPADVSAQNVLDVEVTGADTVSSLGAKAILNYYYFPTF